jgi:hypothetical protein
MMRSNCRWNRTTGVLKRRCAVGLRAVTVTQAILAG